MAIAFGAVTSGGNSPTASITFNSPSVSGSNVMGVVSITFGGADGVDVVQWDGDDMSLVCKRAFGAYANFVYVYALYGVTAGVTSVYVHAANSANNLEASAAFYTGVEQINMLDSSNVNGTGSSETSGSCSTNVIADNSWLVSALVSTGTSVTAGANTTVRVASIGPDFHLSFGDSNGVQAVGSKSQAYSWTTGSPWSVLAAAMRPASTKTFTVDTNGTLRSGLARAFALNGNSTELINALNGTDTSMTYSAGDGIVPQGGAFSGSGYITAADTALPSGNSACSISCWAKYSVQGGNTYGLVGWGDLTSQASQHWLLYMDESDGKIRVDIGGAGATSSSTSGAGTGAFHHLLITYNGTTLSYYLDGGANGTSTMQATPAVVLSGLKLGNADHGGGVNFKGSIDEIYIWNRVLTAQEIADLYNAGAGNTYAEAGETVAAARVENIFRPGYMRIIS